jgi:hypothetical protein
MARKKMSQKFVAKKYGFRSGLELEISDQLQKKNIIFEYEKKKIDYVVPARKAKYTPDFVLANGIIIETKGRFLADDRKKQLLVKEQNPELDIRFVFSSSKAKLSKASKTTYADWCIKNGFKYADKTIPEEWLY